MHGPQRLCPLTETVDLVQRRFKSDFRVLIATSCTNQSTLIEWRRVCRRIGATRRVFLEPETSEALPIVRPISDTSRSFTPPNASADGEVENFSPILFVCGRWESSATTGGNHMRPVPTDQAVISAEAAFEYLGIDRTTGYRAIKDDRFPIPVIRVGRLIKVPTAPLARMLAGEAEPVATQTRSA